MNRKKGIIIGVIILIVIICIILGFVFYANHEKQNQENAVQTYFSYINEQKYEEMYELLTESSKNRISKEDFIKRNKNIYNGIDASGMQTEITEIVKEGKQKKVYYTQTFFTAAGEVKFSNSVLLTKENGYHVDWSSHLIFPELEEDYKVRIATVKAKRGSIKDRSGIELAYDGYISSVGIVPGKLGENKEENIAKISELLEISIEKINEEMNASYVKEDTFVPLKKIERESELKEQLLQIPGIKISNEEARVYSLGEEASHLIGYVQTINEEELKSHEGQNYTTTSFIGKAGMEYTYEQQLRGIDGSEIYIENAEGEKIKEIVKQDKKDGQDITLTIDYDLQKSFYDQMKEDKGLFVVMNPQTGELLALVSTPAYNSNDFVLGMSTEKWNQLNQDPGEPLYNRFKQTYCPGSTFKPITAAIGLTEGVIDAQTEYSYSGTSWQKDTSWGDYFVTTLTKYNGAKNVENALVYSDNIFFAQLGLNIGEEKFSNKLEELKFGEELEFPITLRSSQYLNKDSQWTDGKLANSAYGQGDLLVNPIHMASIYSAFVNEGNMVKPYIEFRQGEMQYLQENVFSKEAVEIVKEAMAKVVETTANDIKVSGMSIIGKTGTAELKKSKEDTESGTLGWFDCITLNRQGENLLVVGMVENTQDNSSGGSHYVISKIRSVLEK